ncbi:MAG: TolC family protein, partial [Cytophagales bacterium]|nr:TolC family protein [Cytophaga sp.]
MKQFIYFTATLLLCIHGFIARAQSDSTLSLSLQQALDLGLKQRFDIKNQELAVQISQSNSSKNLSKNLPQVAASVDFRYNAVLPTSILPPGVVQGKSDYTPIKFGTTYNTLTSLTATQNIFNSNVSGDKLVNQAQEEYDQVSLEKYRTDAKANITQSYYQVLLNQEQITLTKENIKNAEEIVKKGRSEYENGTLLKTDFSRYELDLMNALNQLQTAQRNYDNSIVYLKVQLALDPGTNIILTDALEPLITEAGTVVPGDLNVEQRY